jgi:hypothetical protein
MPRYPRRAYNTEGRELPPLTLAGMRSHGIRSIEAWCRACGHHVAYNVDHLPDDLSVSVIALRLRCSMCGARKIETQPYWREMATPGTRDQRS